MAALNPHNPKIQGLIEDIDTLLESGLSQSASAWKKNAQNSEQLLKRVRNFLTSQSQQELETKTSNKSQGPEEKQQQGQMAAMLAELAQPWQEEIKQLQQQRQELVQEIRELERQRQYNYSLAQQYSKQQQIISEFTEALLGPVQDRIVDYLESIANFQQQKDASNFSTEVAKQDETEAIFPYRRVDRRGSTHEEIEPRKKIFKDALAGKEENKFTNNSQNLEKFPLGENVGHKLPPEGEIFPYPGYEWFDDIPSREHKEELETTPKELLEELAVLPEEVAESLLTSNQEEEDIKENTDEEVDYSDLNGTLLQLEQEETDVGLAPVEKEREVESNSNFEELDGEAERDDVADGSEDRAIAPGTNTVVSGEMQLKQTETTPENLEELSELFGELSQKEEQLEEKQEVKSKTKKEQQEEELSRKAQTEKTTKEKTVTTKETQKKSAIAKVEKEPFVAASADENLLPTETVIEQKNLELLINETTIEQLETDLALLEEVNGEDKDNYLEDDYEWENTVIQTYGDENGELEASFPREFIGKVEEEENETPFILEVSSEEEEDVASLEDFLANISDFSKQKNSEDAGEEEQISFEASEERTLEDILASLTLGEEIPGSDEDNYEEESLMEFLEEKMSPSSKEDN